MKSKEILDTIYNHRTNISIVIRILSLSTCCTYFVPDEYWQSTEVAHLKVYGYGYLTWEWREKIRPYLYSSIFEMYFRCVRFIKADFALVLIYGPHVLQSFLSIAADKALYRLSLKIFKNRDVALFTLVLHWSSWFVFYTSSRTLSNTAEMCFLVLGLSYFPFPYGSEKPCSSETKSCLFLSILLGGIGCIIRPTSLVIWCPLVLGYLLLKVIFLKELIAAVLKVLPILLLLSFGVDYYFYEKFTFAHFNFLKLNIFNNIATFYGTHPFHWYLTQGIPVVFSFQIVFTIAGLYFTKGSLLFSVAILYIVVHSCIPHKEFRFLLPIFPIFICYAGFGMMRMYQLHKTWCRKILILVVFTNVALASYFSLVHQRGTISVMSYLRKSSLKKPNYSVLFLMPCHSTPFYSHLHQNITLKFLTCDPGFGYNDEADLFYKNPLHWLDINVGSLSNKPSHIILFSVLSEKVNFKLISLGYTKEISFFHTHFPEGRIGSHVDVYLYNDISVNL